MKKLIIAAAMISIAAPVAAQAPQAPKPEEVEARFSVISAQRNAALDQIVLLQARVAILEAELAKRADCKAPKKK